MNIQKLIIAVILFPLAVMAQEWIQIDLNEVGSSAGGGTWNVVNTPTNVVGFLKDTNNVTTTATLEISEGWQDSTYATAKGAYASTVFGNSAEDYFFLRSKENGVTNGTFTVSGLSNGVPYVVQLASSIVGSSFSRKADFRVNGDFADSSPNGNNFDSDLDGFVGGNIMTWFPVYPVDGQFIISVVRKDANPEATATLNAIRIGPAGGIMPAPVLTQAQALSDTEIEVVWSGDYSAGTTFVVSYDDGSSTRKLNVGAVRSTWITGLLPSKTYTIRVAPTQSSVSLSAPKTVTTKAPPPGAHSRFVDLN